MTISIRRHAANLALFIVLAFSATAQNSNATFTSNGYTFPTITMNALMRYCDTDSITFDSIMHSFGFTHEENIYTKGSLDKSKMVFGKSQQFGTSLVWISNDKNVAITDRLLEKFAKPAEVNLSDGFSFMYKKYVISVKSTDAEIRYDEINIIDKTYYKINHENQ